MKKTIIIIICLCAVLLSACNYNVVDLQYNYDYAIIQLQITIDGTTYLVHANNCTLIAYNYQY